MKTQISRDSFDTRKRYSGVHLQQGRMITDADWNEETTIARQRLDDALGDVVTSGVPRATGVRIEAVAGQPLRIRSGRLYADGVGALVAGTNGDPAQPFGLNQQADLPLPDGVAPPATNYLLYADVWERAVIAIEDAALRDAAFHGADTSTRTQTMAQLKWCSAGVDPESAAVNPRMGDAKLTLTLRSQLAGLDPCDPCAREITVPPRVGNYLFRLEVHAVEGGPKNPTRLVLKWSSENGAEAHVVGTEPPEFKGSDWVYEYFTTRTEKHVGVHLAGGIQPMTGQLVEGFPAAAPDGFTFVRRWDGYCAITRQGNQWSLHDGRERGVNLSTSSAADADGHTTFANAALGLQSSMLTIDLALSNQTTFVAGDYWLADVRESVHAPGDVVLDAERPVGILHSYLLLATVDNTGAAVVPDTNRQQQLDMPSLATLAARDVDYTANCPSGLFDARHDTVQKALDRVCSIDASQVAFTKPCDTSVYKGVDPAAITTVAKALALLCDVRAGQIGYTNAPACSTLSGATTVQEALDLLCLHESSGGCRTTIGKGGDFPTLNEAVDAFVSRGETALTFCLLPGDHVVDKPIALSRAKQKVLHFALEGSGPASALQVNAEFSFTGCVSVRIADLALTIAPDVTLRADAGEEVVIDGCRVSIADHSAEPPVVIAGSRVVRLADNDVQATRLRRLVVGRGVLSAAAPLRAVFSEDLAETDVRGEAETAAANIAKMPLAQRRKLTAAITKELQDRSSATTPVDRRLAVEEAARIDRVAKLLPSASADLADSLARELLSLRATLVTAEPTLAIVIGVEGGHVDVTGNRIVGELSLYGKPGDIVLTDQQLSEVGKRLATGALRIDGREESLVMVGNQVSRVRVAGDLIIKLRDTASGTVSGVFRATRFTDNVFTLDGSDIVSVETTLSGNRFAEVDKGTDSRLAAVIAPSALYVGNQLPPNDRFTIRNISLRKDTSARRELNVGFIVDL